MCYFGILAFAVYVIVVSRRVFAFFFEGGGLVRFGCFFGFLICGQATTTTLLMFISGHRPCRCQLHSLDSGDGDGAGGHNPPQEAVFPQNDKAATDITCMSLTGDVLVYGTSSGTIAYFLTSEWAAVNDYKHSRGITLVAPNATGTRLVFIDESQVGVGRGGGGGFCPVRQRRGPKAGKRGVHMWKVQGCRFDLACHLFHFDDAIVCARYLVDDAGFDFFF